VEWFDGFEVIIAMDNDDAGRQNLEEALYWLSKVEAQVRVLTLPGLGRRKGVDDWLEVHTADELKALVDKTPYEPNINRIEVINPVDLAGRPVPERMFLAGPLIPFPNVTLLYGDGGAGKSQIGLQLAVARAIKKEWLGLHTIAGKTLILSAEDDEDEIHRRLASICLHYKCSLVDLGDMRVIDLVGQDAVIGELMRNGRIVATDLYHFMIREISSFEPTLVIVDALSDAFAGDENNRTQARQFIGMLRRPSVRYRCSFMPIAHPSLSGITSGRGTSGSTGWNNSVRSRLYFEGVEVAGGEPDPDLKRLREPKGNYGRPGFELLTRYENGVYVPFGGAGTMDRAAKAAQAENVFMAILKRLTEQGRFVGSSAGVNYAPAVFVTEAEATELMVSKDQLKAAMIRLFREKRIRIEEYVGPNYSRKMRIAEAPF
jgi:RecA-family ATPase